MSKTPKIIRSIALWIVALLGIFLLNFLLKIRNFSGDAVAAVDVGVILVAIVGTFIIWSK